MDMKQHATKKNESVRKIRKYLETNENGNTTLEKSIGCSKSSSKTEAYSNLISPQQISKTSYKQY